MFGSTLSWNIAIGAASFFVGIGLGRMGQRPLFHKQVTPRTINTASALYSSSSDKKQEQTARGLGSPSVTIKSLDLVNGFTRIELKHSADRRFWVGRKFTGVGQKSVGVCYPTPEHVREVVTPNDVPALLGFVRETPIWDDQNKMVLDFLNRCTRVPTQSEYDSIVSSAGKPDTQRIGAALISCVFRVNSDC